MKFSFLNPWKKKPHEKQINPFNHDGVSMGVQVGNGRLCVMFYSHNDYKYVYLVDTLTGQRAKVEFDEILLPF